MLVFEPAREVKGGFENYADALWWTAMLLTTMGSGFWPFTAEGRVLSLLLSIYGIVVFGYITASFATFFIGQEAQDQEGEVPRYQRHSEFARGNRSFARRHPPAQELIKFT